MKSGKHLPLLQNTNKYLPLFHSENGDCMFLPDIGTYISTKISWHNISGDSNLQGTNSHTQLAKRFCNNTHNHYQLTTCNYLSFSLNITTTAGDKELLNGLGNKYITSSALFRVY
jgi:hypothetical protein